LLPILAQFPSLETLNLTNNNLRSLPSDLSSLKQLHSLHINNNLFEDFNELVKALQTLPSLKVLSLNLHHNEEVELVLNVLTNLQVLNDQGTLCVSILEIEHDEGNQKEGSSKVTRELEGCEVEIEQKNSQHPEHKDIANEIALSQHEALEEAVAIHDNFSAYSKKREPSKDKELEIEFRQQMIEIANKLKTQVNASPRTKRLSLLRARNGILEISFKRMIELALDEESAKIWSTIKKEHNDILQELLQMATEHKQQTNEDNIKALRKQFEMEKRELKSQIASLESENKKYLDTLIKRSKMTSKVSAPKQVHNKPKESKRTVSY
jgi:hypothetical protein